MRGSFAPREKFENSRTGCNLMNKFNFEEVFSKIQVLIMEQITFILQFKTGFLLHSFCLIISHSADQWLSEFVIEIGDVTMNV